MRFPFLFTLCLLLATGGLAAPVQDHPPTYLDFIQNEAPVVRYMYAYDVDNEDARHASYKVYHHVLDRDGKQFLTKGPGGKFTHHRGIFLGWSRISHAGRVHDLWHMKGQAAQVHQKFSRQESDDQKTLVAAQIKWLGKDGTTHLLDETRTITIHHSDDSAYLLLDFESTLTPADGDVILDGDPEHAGFQFRPHDDVSKNKSAAYTFHADGVDPKTVRDLPWVAETFQLRGEKWTVQHMNHPDNPDSTLYSAYRDYGRFGAFPKVSLADGETLTLRYRIRITPGAAPARETLAEQYQKYAD